MISLCSFIITECCATFPSEGSFSRRFVFQSPLQT